MPEEKDVLTSPNPEVEAGVEGQEKEKTQPVIDWEANDNPYKKRYGDSQGQVTPLVRTLQQFAEYDHNTKTWKPKTQASQPASSEVDDVDKILEGYDPDFRKALGGYVSRQVQDGINKFRQESAFMTEYNSGIQAARSKAIEEFGSEFDFSKDGKFNT